MCGMRRARVLAAVALPLIVLAGCGGSEKPEGAEPAVWADDVCTAVLTWFNGVQSSAGDLQRTLPSVASVEEAHSQLVDFLAATVDQTDEMLADVEAAGAPAIEDGEAASRDLRSALVRVKQIFVDAKAKAEKLPVTDLLAFASAVQELATSIRTELEDVGGTFNDLQTRYKDLDLGEDQPASCRKLGNLGA